MRGWTRFRFVIFGGLCGCTISAGIAGIEDGRGIGFFMAFLGFVGIVVVSYKALYDDERKG